MAQVPGGFIWYELLTSDPDAAERFYGDVVGWNYVSHDGPPGGTRYRVARAGDVGIAGQMAMPADAAAQGMRPSWHGYLHVADTDAAVAATVAAGGRAWMPATDIADVGRIAMLCDPQGAPFYVMQPGRDGESASFSPSGIGHVTWNELTVDDVGAALVFYTRQFGWTRGEPMPMGAMGDYEILLHGDGPIGGAMKRPEGGPPPMWQFYFRVPAIEQAAARVRTGGGQVVVGPLPIPGGEHMIAAIDPQGASFGLVAAS